MDISHPARRCAGSRSIQIRTVDPSWPWICSTCSGVSYTVTEAMSPTHHASVVPPGWVSSSVRYEASPGDTAVVMATMEGEPAGQDPVAHCVPSVADKMSDCV